MFIQMLKIMSRFSKRTKLVWTSKKIYSLNFLMRSTKLKILTTH